MYADLNERFISAVNYGGRSLHIAPVFFGVLVTLR